MTNKFFKAKQLVAKLTGYFTFIFDVFRVFGQIARVGGLILLLIFAVDIVYEVVNLQKGSMSIEKGLAYAKVCERILRV
jgi:hypothetical protein